VRRAAAVVAALGALLLVPAAAAAQESSGQVTLEASASSITFGDDVELSGTASGAPSGQAVRILDASSAEVASTTTGSGGRFSVTIRPDRTAAYRASWGSAQSDEVTVGVRAVLAIRMSPVRLFDDVVVRGTVSPARPGERVEVQLRRGGHVAERQRAEVGAAGGFRVTFRVMAPGTYRARATFTGDDLARGTAVTGADQTPLPSLRSGSRGVFVRLLEARLAELRYRLVAANDERYDWRTADAVIAFHKVQRMARLAAVGPATWRALADPLVSRARYDWKGFHFEVDQTRQVLLAVRGGEVTAILHVSTGKASTPTRDGVFRVVRKIAGYSPNRLYYPSYFDGNRALHGWTEVPTYAASHGCVRIPYWNAQWVYGLAAYGTRIAVYH
jgi:hypothetical protein